MPNERHPRKIISISLYYLRWMNGGGKETHRLLWIPYNVQRKERKRKITRRLETDCEKPICSIDTSQFRSHYLYNMRCTPTFSFVAVCTLNASQDERWRVVDFMLLSFAIYNLKSATFHGSLPVFVMAYSKVLCQIGTVQQRSQADRTISYCTYRPTLSYSENVMDRQTFQVNIWYNCSLANMWLVGT